MLVAFRMLPKGSGRCPAGMFQPASLLPMYRGAAPINHVLIQGEKETGLTTFLIDEHMDTGAILLQERIPVEDTDTAGTLLDKMTEAAGPLIAKTIDGLFHKTIRATPQPVLQESMLKTAPKITKETCRINWNRPPAEIVNLYTGTKPCSGCLYRMDQTRHGQPATHTSFYKNLPGGHHKPLVQKNRVPS